MGGKWPSYRMLTEFNKDRPFLYKCFVGHALHLSTRKILVFVWHQLNGRLISHGDGGPAWLGVR